MTTVLHRPSVHITQTQPQPRRLDSLKGTGIRAAFRRLGADAITVTGWAMIAASIAVFLADRTAYHFSTPSLALTSAGVIAGLMATTVMVQMLLLSARIPLVDRVIGHDRAIAMHGRLGKWLMITLLSHAGLLTAAWTIDSGTLLGGVQDLWSVSDMALAIVALGLIVVVAASSIVAVMKKLPREVWHGIHLTTYVAFGLAIPHQFTGSGIFAAGISRAYWVILLSTAVAAVIAFRFIKPIIDSVEHSLVVSNIRAVGHNSVAITLTGRNLAKLEVNAGQFFQWRFWAPGLWWHTHPFSISAAPDGQRLQITVRALGRGSAAIQRLRPGTRVSFEGPYGLFSQVVRTREAVVLAGAGVGLAPIHSILESMECAPGRTVVIARGSQLGDLVHFNELRNLCHAKGATLVPLIGSRGRGWAPANAPATRLTDLAPWIADADLYICGPEGWTQALVAEAALEGLDKEHIHTERFN